LLIGGRLTATAAVCARLTIRQADIVNIFESFTQEIDGILVTNQQFSWGLNLDDSNSNVIALSTLPVSSSSKSLPDIVLNDGSVVDLAPTDAVGTLDQMFAIVELLNDE